MKHRARRVFAMITAVLPSQAVGLRQRAAAQVRVVPPIFVIQVLCPMMKNAHDDTSFFSTKLSILSQTKEPNRLKFFVSVTFLSLAGIH